MCCRCTVVSGVNLPSGQQKALDPQFQDWTSSKGRRGAQQSQRVRRKRGWCGSYVPESAKEKRKRCTERRSPERVIGDNGSSTYWQGAYSDVWSEGGSQPTAVPLKIVFRVFSCKYIVFIHCAICCQVAQSSVLWNQLAVHEVFSPISSLLHCHRCIITTLILALYPCYDFSINGSAK